MQPSRRLCRHLRMELMRYVIPHLLAGCVAGVVAAVTMVATNLGSMRDLIFHTDGGWLGFVLLIFGFVITFGSVAIGHGIMSIADED